MVFKAKNTFTILLSLLLFSCGNDENSPINPIPDKFIFETINLQTDIRAQPIAPISGRDQNYIYWIGGWRGLIIYRVSINQFRAFERNCPYQWDQICANVKVDASGLFMKDSCCGTTYDWFGNPTGGPGRIPLKQYPVGFQSENTLVVGSQL